MVDVKPIGQVVAKWKTRSGAAGTDYTQGAIAAASKYAQEAGKAGDSYNQGVQQAISRGAYQSGVQKAGAGKYQQGVQSKGAQRYAGGVAAGEQNYNAGIQGVLSTLGGITLPPRGPRGSPGNIQRVAAIAQALRSAKTGGAGV